VTVVVAALAAASLVPAGPAGAAGAGTAYKGKSAQKLAVSLSGPRSFGRTFSYRATMNCSDGTTFTDGTFADDVGISGRRFKDRYTSDKGAVRNQVAGVLHGSRASGTLRVIERFRATADAHGFFPLDPKGTVRCDSGQVRWTAKRR